MDRSGRNFSCKRQQGRPQQYTPCSFYSTKLLVRTSLTLPFWLVPINPRQKHSHLGSEGNRSLGLQGRAVTVSGSFGTEKVSTALHPCTQRSLCQLIMSPHGLEVGKTHLSQTQKASRLPLLPPCPPATPVCPAPALLPCTLPCTACLYGKLLPNQCPRCLITLLSQLDKRDMKK